METCPCGSQNSPDKCCNPEVPPIYAEAPRFVRSCALHTVDMPFSIKRYQVNYSVESGPGILSQVDPVIAEAPLGFDMTQVQLFSPSMRNTLVFPLHAVRYHLQQLMYRLRFLQKEVTQQVREAANDPRVQYFQCEDIALRSELESFVIRLAAYLDALAKYIAASIGASVKAHGSHNKMQNHLNGEVGRKRNEHQAIREICLSPRLDRAVA